MSDANTQHLKPFAIRTPLPTADADHPRMSLVRRGLPKPKGSGFYLVEETGGGDVVVLAYMDGWGRAFQADGASARPPARTPDVAWEGYDPRSDGAGDIVIRAGRSGALRVGRWEATKGRVTLSRTRVDLGGDPQPLPADLAMAKCYLALWALPHELGIDLKVTGAHEVLAHMRGDDVFQVVDAIAADAQLACEHPVLRPQGVTALLAAHLESIGITGKDAPTLAVHDDDELSQLISSSGLQMVGELLGIQPTSIPGLMSAIKRKDPTIRLLKTDSYSRGFYIAFPREEVSNDGAAMLVETESALNRFVALVTRLGEEEVERASAGECADLDRELVRTVAERLMPPYLAGEVINGVDPREGATDALGIRLNIARAFELLSLPYRLEYWFNVSVDLKHAVVEVAVPQWDLMPRFAGTPDGSLTQATDAQRHADSLTYGINLLHLIAAATLWSSPLIERVTVNLRDDVGSYTRVLQTTDEQNAADTLGPCCASLTVGRDDYLARMADPAARALIATDAPRSLEGLDHAVRVSAEGGLAEVTAPITVESPLLAPDYARTEIEKVTAPLSPAAHDLLHADELADLRIYESADRRVLADDVVARLHADDEAGAIELLKDAHDRTENLRLRNACTMMCDAIALGFLPDDDPDGYITSNLIDIWGLDGALRRSGELVKTDPAAAVQMLRGALEELDSQGTFDDSTTRCYRYFDSYTTRMIWGARMTGGQGDEALTDDARGRRVRLCPDEYFVAHFRLAATMSDSVDDAEEAIVHARRCVQLAPTVAGAYLRLARCYFNIGDFRSEIDVLVSGLPVMWRVKDLAVAMYWLGYAYWMCDEHELGLACYAQCVMLDPTSAETVSAEVANLVNSTEVEGLALPDPEVADALLAMSGIPTDAPLVNARLLRRCASLAIESGSFVLARQLLAASAPTLPDDALGPVMESLS